MNVKIKERERKYYIGFEVDNSKVFTKGPHTGGLRTVTTCKICLVTEAEASGLTLVGRGTTTLGPRDRPNSLIGCKIALSRALDSSGLGKFDRAAFWQEFRARHGSLSVGDRRFNTKLNAVHGYGSRYTWQRLWNDSWQHRAVAEVRKATQSCQDEQTRAKERLFGHIYGKTIKNPTTWDYAELERRIAAGQAESRVGEPVPHEIKSINTVNYAEALDKVRIKKIVGDEERKRHGLWAVSNTALAGHNEFKRVHAELMSRPGVKRVGDEYIIDPDVFEPRFRVGQVLRYEGKVVRVTDVDGPVLTLAGRKTAMDWEVELLVQPSLAVRVLRWLCDRIDPFSNVGGDDNETKRV